MTQPRSTTRGHRWLFSSHQTYMRTCRVQRTGNDVFSLQLSFRFCSHTFCGSRNAIPSAHRMQCVTASVCLHETWHRRWGTIVIVRPKHPGDSTRCRYKKLSLKRDKVDRGMVRTSERTLNNLCFRQVPAWLKSIFYHYKITTVRVLPKKRVSFCTSRTERVTNYNVHDMFRIIGITSDRNTSV